MTITAESNRATFIGNGLATEFDYEFPVQLATDMKVYLRTDDAEELVSPSAYSATGLGGPNGGTVTYPLTGDPISTNQRLVILREVPYDQPLDLYNQSTFYAETIEAELDRIVMMLQQMQEELDRKFGVSITDPITPTSIETLLEALVGEEVAEQIGAGRYMAHVYGTDGLLALTLPAYATTPGLFAAHMTSGLRDATYFWDANVSWATYQSLDPLGFGLVYPNSGQDGAWVDGKNDPRAGLFSDSEPVPGKKLRIHSGVFVGKAGSKYYGALSDTVNNALTSFWAHDVGTVGDWSWTFANAMNIFERQNGKINTSIISESPVSGAGLTIGLQVSAVGIHTDTADTHGVWAMYGEGIAMPGHNSNTRVFEFNGVNLALDITDEMSEKPYTSRSDLKFVGALAAGGDVNVHGASFALDEYLRINQNGGKAWSGIMIRNNALMRDVNGEARAITMAEGHSFVWYGPGDNIIGRIVVNNTIGNSMRLAFSDSEIGITFKGKRVIHLTQDVAGVNYLSTGQSAAGQAVGLRARGDDAAIDLLLDPFGAGVIQLGQAMETTGNFTANRRFKVKDANGTVVYLLASST